MILLSFNIIQNRPETSSGQLLSEKERLGITVSNVNSILRILELHETKCTFFLEVPLLTNAEFNLKKIVDKGHEIAVYGEGYTLEQIRDAKTHAEKITEKTIRGFRQMRRRFSIEELKMLEFNYISDIENATILFPLRRLERGTELTEIKGITIIPESISPYSQIPYNDFVLQSLPMKFYRSMVTETLKNEEFVIIYLNTWQFTDFAAAGLKTPFYRRWNSGKKMEDKLTEFLEWINERDYATARIKDYIF